MEWVKEAQAPFLHEKKTLLKKEPNKRVLRFHSFLPSSAKPHGTFFSSSSHIDRNAIPTPTHDLRYSSDYNYLSRRRGAALV